MVKSNALATSSYMLSINGFRLSALAITKINRRRSISPGATFRVHVDEWRNFFGGNRTTSYENLQAAARNLREAQITLTRRPNGKPGSPIGGTAKLVEQCHYEPLAAHVEIIWSQKISSYLTGLESNFLKYDVRDIALMTNAYAVKIYELCLANRPRDSASYSLDELRRLLRLQACPSYLTSWKLRQRVIDPAIAQINANTPLKLTSTPIFEGRRITGIHLNWVVRSKANEARRNRTMTRTAQGDAEFEAPKRQQENDTATLARRATPSTNPSIRPNETTIGHRLPEDWTLPEDYRQWASKYSKEKNQPLTEAEIRDCADQFADHWRSKPGEDGRKADWKAAWRYWIRNKVEWRTQRAATHQKPKTQSRMQYQSEGKESPIMRAARLKGYV